MFELREKKREGGGDYIEMIAVVREVGGSSYVIVSMSVLSFCSCLGWSDFSMLVSRVIEHASHSHHKLFLWESKSQLIY